jgi:nucleoside-diphosphate-sugar epimerase
MLLDKVVILGDGLLGSEIKKQTNWDVVSRKLGNLNINDYLSVTKTIKDYNVVINCIANTNSYSHDNQQHWNINYKFPSMLSDLCKTLNIKLVHISTEFVYANNKIPPTEDDLPIPDNTWYAYTKLLADEYIKLTNNNFLICRELHKPNPFPYKEVWDIKTSGDTVDKIANLIIRLIEKNASGVYNVGTGDKFLRELAPSSKVVPSPAHVPKDTRMNLDKLNRFLKL